MSEYYAMINNHIMLFDCVHGLTNADGYTKIEVRLRQPLDSEFIIENIAIYSGKEKKVFEIHYEHPLTMRDSDEMQIVHSLKLPHSTRV